MKSRLQSAFTLIELLVVITIIGILAGIALPAFSAVQERAGQTKSLASAKQIGLALKLYAGDNDGQFPAKAGDPVTGPAAADATTANDAFKNLFPAYLTQEKIFWVSKSHWSNKAPPDEDASTATKCLSAGENDYAYVRGLNDTSNPSFPLVATGLASGSTTQYTTDKAARGGVWAGQKAVVVKVDQSGEIMKVDPALKAPVVTPPGGAKQSIFSPAANWLNATENPVLPPVASSDYSS